MAQNKKAKRTADVSANADAQAPRAKKTKKKSASPEELASAAAKKNQRRKKAKTHLSRGAKIVLVIIGIAAMVLSVSAMACSGVINQATNSESYHLTGGVAATVDGVSITEDTVTKQIMSVRSGSYDSDEDWAQYLVDNDMTPESYRENVINSLANQYLIQAAEKEYNITVSDEEIDEKWNETVENYDSEDAFIEQIEMFGYTKDTYKEQLESSLKQEKLKEAVADVDDPTDDEIIEYLNENLDTYNDARRSENILFKVDSDATDDEKAEIKEKAQEVLDKINSGELSFEDAVSEYSEDTGSKDDDGDVGWDKLTSFVDEYQTALEGLSKGEVSGIVESSYGYHIIKCTNYFHVDDEVTSIDQVPKKIRSYIKNILKTQEESTAYNDWLEQYTEDANITINDMPEDVPYNVSLDGVTKSTDDDSTTTTATTTDSSDSDASDSSDSTDSDSDSNSDSTSDSDSE